MEFTKELELEISHRATRFLTIHGYSVLIHPSVEADSAELARLVSPAEKLLSHDLSQDQLRLVDHIALKTISMLTFEDISYGFIAAQKVGPILRPELTQAYRYYLLAALSSELTIFDQFGSLIAKLNPGHCLLMTSALAVGSTVVGDQGSSKYLMSIGFGGTTNYGLVNSQVLVNLYDQAISLPRQEYLLEPDLFQVESTETELPALFDQFCGTLASKLQLCSCRLEPIKLIKGQGKTKRVLIETSKADNETQLVLLLVLSGTFTLTGQDLKAGSLLIIKPDLVDFNLYLLNVDSINMIRVDVKTLAVR